MLTPITRKTETKIIDNKEYKIKKLYKELIINNSSKFTINTITLREVISILNTAIDTYNKLLESGKLEPAPEPAPPTQSAEPPEDLSQQMHFQITFTVCKLNPEQTVLSNPFVNQATKTITSTDSTCYHKAYIKSVLPKNTNISDCKNIVAHAEHIYEATQALYSLKNNGYRLVKLVDGHEHDYFKNNPEGFVKQATKKVTEYTLGDTPPVGEPLENIIDTSELIKNIGYIDGLDVAFLASNPDTTDLENMAMLRNGISYFFIA